LTLYCFDDIVVTDAVIKAVSEAMREAGDSSTHLNTLRDIKRAYGNRILTYFLEALSLSEIVIDTYFHKILIIV
jgi:hypothetical protein